MLHKACHVGALVDHECINVTHYVLNFTIPLPFYKYWVKTISSLDYHHRNSNKHVNALLCHSNN